MIMTQLRPGVHWVGVREWAKKFFHGHELSIAHGTSYNSYLIVDEKIALIDSVKNEHAEEFLQNVSRIVPLSKIDYFIVNHGEPDHSGAFTRLLAANPRAKVVASKNGAQILKRHYPGAYDVQVMKTGDQLSLGKKTLKFFDTQMLHWPDSIFAYCPEEKILFPNDAFGQHYASSSLYADECDQCEVWQEAIKYFANILTPYSARIIVKVGEFVGLGWPVEMICPSHGLIWRKDPLTIVNKYVEWASGKAQAAVVVIYDTIWHGTEKMARSICRGLETEGVPFRLFNAGTSDFNDVMTEILKARGVLVGGPTLNNNLMPTLVPYLESIRGLRFVNKIGAAFGTYGWSGEGVGRIEEFLVSGGVKIVQVGYRVSYAPGEEDLKQCEVFGQQFARQVKES